MRASGSHPTDNRPLLVFLRPHQTLADQEMNYVRLLEDEFRLRVVTMGANTLGTVGDVPGLVRLSWPDEITWGGRPRSFLNGIYARGLRRRYHMPGLAPHLAGATFVQAGEAASEYTFQAAQMKERHGFRLLLSASENQPILEGRTSAHADRIRFTLSRVDHAFAIPPDARERLVEAGLPQERITVIGHGIDCERFRPAAAGNPEHQSSGALRVGFCGRFRSEKGLQHLVDAVRDLNVTLELCGDGPDRESLLQSAGPNTRITPPLPYARVHEFYQGVDVFVLPSVPLPGLVEQFGFVLLESMASGVPVIASSIGGIPGVLGDAGLLVPPGDTAALRAAIARLAVNPELRAELAQRGRARALAKFRREGVAEKMRVVYRSLMRS